MKLVKDKFGQVFIINEGNKIYHKKQGINKRVMRLDSKRLDSNVEWKSLNNTLI